MNININCRKFLRSSFSILQKCGGLKESVLCEIILTKFLPIPMYGIECFRLLESQRQKIKVLYYLILL